MGRLTRNFSSLFSADSRRRLGRGMEAEEFFINSAARILSFSLWKSYYAALPNIRPILRRSRKPTNATSPIAPKIVAGSGTGTIS